MLKIKSYLLPVMHNKKLHAEAKSGAFFVFRFASFYTKKHVTSGSGELGIMRFIQRSVK